MNNQCGQDHARANLSAKQARRLGLLTSGTYGRPSTGSSNNVNLMLSLVNKYQARTVFLGSTLYNLTWKERTTPAGVPFYAQQARACHILGKGYSGLPTPTAGEFRDFSQPQILAKLDKGGRVARWICSRSLTALSYKGTLGLNPCFARWMMGIPQEWDDCAPTETPSLRMSQKNS
jgi:hypothetical protein